MLPDNDEETKCSLCNVLTYPEHNSTLLHRFNFALFEWNDYRKKLVKNCNGIEVNIELVDIEKGTLLKYSEVPKKGLHVAKLSVPEAKKQRNGFTFLFTVKNIQKSNVFLQTAFLLYSYEYFFLDDFEGELQNNCMKDLEPGAVYTFKVQFAPNIITIGDFKMAVSIQFQTLKKLFTIAREIGIDITDENDPILETKTKSPFTNASWVGIKNVYEPITLVKAIENYLIPKEYYKLLKMGLMQFSGISFSETTTLHTLRGLLNPGYVTVDNYKDYFHIALWVEEMAATLMLRRYNMENVTMNYIDGKLLELEVPGLAEKRPSLIPSDIIRIRCHGDHTVYKGIIQRVNNTNIHITSVEPELLETIADYSDTELDVAFDLGRLAYERMHLAVDVAVKNKIVNQLFGFGQSTAGYVGNRPLNDHEFINKSILKNDEQKRAVINILNCTSGLAPYIVFGPPGTGKTITIVEAILQIKRFMSRKTILVCAPANAACDMLTSKLIESNMFNKKELIRVHTTNRDWNTVPGDVKLYSNYIESCGYKNPSGNELMKYRVVVTTLILSGRYSIHGEFKPDYVFIDEAAQALEPEALVAISLLKTNGQLILAGDPEQLGPQCSSSVAQKLKLDCSLLERLMALPLYKSNNSRFITMLRLNFRAHPIVLKVPNSLFYDDQLLPMSQEALTDQIANIFIYNKIEPNTMNLNIIGQPVEFCSIFSKEQREGKSPSYFNTREIEMVFKYVKELLALVDCEPKVEESHIGIVTPYVRQMYRIKDKLQHNGFSGVEVGTPEVFQGREKRIIIISTVRAQASLLLYDKKYKLGFIKNKKRFNVALTRAKSKLIIIGCPNVLRYDKHWQTYISFCIQLNAYFGATQDNRTENLKRDIINRLKQVYH